MRSLVSRGGLWRHRDFMKLWSAETISQFGTQVSQLALPFIAITILDASAFSPDQLAGQLIFPRP